MSFTNTVIIQVLLGFLSMMSVFLLFYMARSMKKIDNDIDSLQKTTTKIMADIGDVKLENKDLEKSIALNLKDIENAKNLLSIVSSLSSKIDKNSKDINEYFLLFKEHQLSIRE